MRTRGRCEPWSAVVALLSALLFAGCGGGGRAEALRIAFVPQVDMEERYAGAYRALDAYLSERMDVEVEVVLLENANLALEALRAGKVDACNLSPWPLILAEEKAGVEALVFTVAPGGELASYRSLLVAHPGSGIRNLDELKAQGRRVVFTFEEPVSTSGHLIPRAHLDRVGIVPERDFKTVLYGPDGVVNLLAARSGRVDVAAISDSTYRRSLEKRRVVEGDVVILWTSDPILSSILSVRRGLNPEVKRRLQELLVAMPVEAPEQFAEVAKQYSQPVAGYRAAETAVLEPYREAVRRVPALRLVN